MSDWMRWSLPVAALSAVASPAYAVVYMSLPAAQKAAFPTATSFVEYDGRSWKAMAGDQLLGLVVLDHVIGKHLYIDYTVALDTSGRVKRVDILTYRESYGGEVRDFELARAIRRQGQRQHAQCRQRHPQHLRRDPVVAPRHRRREAGARDLWREGAIACRRHGSSEIRRARCPSPSPMHPVTKGGLS